jgi:hypothetical protein
MKNKTVITFLIAFLLAITVTEAQENTKSIAISLNSVGQEKSFNGVVEKMENQTGFTIKAQCNHLNIIVFEYNAEIYRDRLAILNYLKEKGYAFEVREGITAENISTVCKDNTHTE